MEMLKEDFILLRNEAEVEAERLINRRKLNLDLSLINGSRNFFLLHISFFVQKGAEGAR